VGSKLIFGIFVTLALAYLGLTFGTPPDAASANKYHLSNEEIRLLQLTITIPLIAIWFVAYYGYSRFNRYAVTVKDSPEGRGWKNFVEGLLLLALWLPVSSVINRLTRYLYHDNKDLVAPLTIVKNYVSLLILLAAFALLYKGANKLLKSIDQSMPDVLRSKAMALLVLVSGLFAYVALISPNKRVAADEASRAAYYLPDWLIILTIIIPYIIIFYLGFRVVQDINLYRRNATGVLYRSSLSLLAKGVGIVILLIMALRYFESLTGLLSQASLKVFLLVIYILVFLIAAGFVVIALGAKKLQKMEEV
jgi:uncharacterized membrane protein YidH (DUF202 family)